MIRAVFELQNPEGGTSADTPPEVLVNGEVDVTNVEEFTRSVQAVPGTRPIILELNGLKYLDSAGFAALDRLLAKDAIVVVLSPESLVYKAAELLCLPLHHEVEAARRALQENTS
jgi:anti-sigma B factor antagonist